MILKHCFALAFLVFVSSAWAQVPHYNYFPASFCQEQGIRSISVYRTKVDSAAKTTNPNKTIRLAKDAVRHWEFDSLGRQVKETLLMEGSANTQQEVILGYNGMAIIREEMAYYHTNNAGITSSILKQVHYNSYDAQSQRSHRVGYLLSDTGQKYLDSTAYTRDAQGRLIHEILRNNPRYSKEVYEKRYTYTSDKIAISSFMNQFVLNRDEYILDEQGRMVQEINYAPDEKPRLQTNYTYDTAGRLIRLDYLPDWDYFQPAETVVSRKNTYDSRGKLVEARLEYGDGKYMLELYDYTLMSEE